MKELKIERETYEGKDGKKYFSYMVKTKVYGKEVEIDFQPKDGGGYVIFDILFEQATDGVKLEATAATMTDEKTGKEISYTAYRAVCVNADGEEMAADIKPKRNSDKTLIAFLMQERAKAAAKANEAK